MIYNDSYIFLIVFFSFFTKSFIFRRRCSRNGGCGEVASIGTESDGRTPVLLEVVRGGSRIGGEFRGKKLIQSRGIFSHLQVPYTLAENAGLSPIHTVTELRSQHANGNSSMGVNVRKVIKIRSLLFRSHNYGRLTEKWREKRDLYIYNFFSIFSLFYPPPLYLFMGHILISPHLVISKPPNYAYFF